MKPCTFVICLMTLAGLCRLLATTRTTTRTTPTMPSTSDTSTTTAHNTDAHMDTTTDNSITEVHTKIQTQTNTTDAMNSTNTTDNTSTTYTESTLPNTSHPLCTITLHAPSPQSAVEVSPDSFCYAPKPGTEALNFDTLRHLLPPADALQRSSTSYNGSTLRAALRTLRTPHALHTAHCAGVPEYGFGALLAGIVKASAVALSANTSYALQELRGIWSGRGATLSTYFHHDTIPSVHQDCTESAGPLPMQVWRRKCTTMGARKRCKRRSYAVTLAEAHAKVAQRADLATPAPFWLAAEALSTLMTPQHAAVEREVAALLAHTRLDTPERAPFLAVQIRRGDSCSDSAGWDDSGAVRSCSPLEAYVPYIKEMMSRYRFRTVFIVTDDEAIRVDGGTALLRLGVEVPVVTSPFPAHVFRDANGTKCVIERAVGMDAPQVGQRFLAELHVLSQAHAFVGKFTSSVFRTAYMLSAVRDAVPCARPVLSLDAPFCFDPGVRRGINCDTQASFMC